MGRLVNIHDLSGFCHALCLRLQQLQQSLTQTRNPGRTLRRAPFRRGHCCRLYAGGLADVKWYFLSFCISFCQDQWKSTCFLTQYTRCCVVGGKTPNTWLYLILSGWAKFAASCIQFVSIPPKSCPVNQHLEILCRTSSGFNGSLP
jgi:hypothetical protein